MNALPESTPVAASAPAASSAAPVAVRRAARSSVWTAAGGLVVVAVLAVLPFVVVAGFTDPLVTLFALVTMASMWNLLAGFGGLVSIGQQAYIGLGAYAVLVLADAGVSPFIGVLLAAVVAAVFAVPTSWLAFRLRGDYFAVGTWVIAEVYRLVVSRVGSLGGASGKSLTGLSGIDPTLRGALTYWLALAVAVVTLLVCFLLLRGRTGLALSAVRDDDLAARAAGVDVGRAKRLVYLVSAAGCGAAGGVLIVSALSVNPSAIFNVQYSAYMIFIVVIGGIGFVEGPVLGALVFFVLQQTLSDQGSWYLIVLGLLGVLVALFVPRGLWGEIAARTGVRLFGVGHHVLGVDGRAAREQR